MPKKKPTLDLTVLFDPNADHEFGHDDFVSAATIQPQAPKWFWRQRLVKDDLNILAGTQGAGKSQVATAIAAEATQRGESVLVISAEDSPAHTIVPRLIAAGAVMRDAGGADLVHIWRQNGEWDLSQAEKLQQYVYRHEASLVIIDPIAAFVTGATDTYKDSHVRSILAPLRAIAEDQECTILAVMHLKKGAEAEAVNTVGGSIAWTAAPRSVLMVQRLAEDREQRMLLHPKCNVGPEQPALAFRVVPVDYGEQGPFTTSFVEWGQEDPSYDYAMAFPPQVDKRSQAPHPALDRALEWLKGALEDGEVSSFELDRGREAEGISVGTYKKARKLLSVRTENRGGTWYTMWP